jgi:hypothetical protein
VEKEARKTLISIKKRFGVRQLAAAFASRACSSGFPKQASGEGKRQQAAALQSAARFEAV